VEDKKVEDKKVEDKKVEDKKVEDKKVIVDKVIADKVTPTPVTQTPVTPIPVTPIPVTTIPVTASDILSTSEPIVVTATPTPPATGKKTLKEKAKTALTDNKLANLFKNRKKDRDDDGPSGTTPK
jgi:hypothetical protein